MQHFFWKHLKKAIEYSNRTNLVFKYNQIRVHPDMKIPEKYRAVIGLEVHVQLNTATKAFCRCDVSYGAPPNSHVCPVCLGLPGALPVVNEKAVEMTIRLGLALGCEIHNKTRFARKNYFYPDLPKGYQITQSDTPFCTNGWIPLSPLQDRAIGITRIHLEEDAGKSFHGRDETLVDFNRCGVPLAEIVSEPELQNPVEAVAYLKQLRRIVRYLELSDGDMEKGSMRCDANISVTLKNQIENGTKVEIKNLNSINGVKRALEFEIQRQVQELENGGSIYQETRLWDENGRRTRVIRTKEDSPDYRYFPEPDLPEVVLPEDCSQEILPTLPELAHQKVRRYHTEWKIPIEDAETIAEDQSFAKYFEEVIACNPQSLAQEASNWMKTEVKRVCKNRRLSIHQLPVGPRRLADLLTMSVEKRIQRAGAKIIFEQMLDSSKSPETIADEKGLWAAGGMVDLDKIAIEVIAEYPDQVNSYREGKKKLLGFFMGQAMRKVGDAINPGELSAVFVRLLGDS